jgi:hypothetical protein
VAVECPQDEEPRVAVECPQDEEPRVAVECPQDEEPRGAVECPQRRGAQRGMIIFSVSSRRAFMGNKGVGRRMRSHANAKPKTKLRS